MSNLLPSHVYLVYVKGDKKYRVFTNMILAQDWREKTNGTIIPYVIETPEGVNHVILY